MHLETVRARFVLEFKIKNCRSGDGKRTAIKTASKTALDISYDTIN